MQAERELNRLSFNDGKFAKSSLNSLIIPLGIIAFVCLDFPKFIDVKMRSTLKQYFLDDLLQTRAAAYYMYDKQAFAVKSKKDVFKA